MAVRILCLLLITVACGTSSRPPSDASINDRTDGANAPDGAGADAESPRDAATTCACIAGPHSDNIYVISDDGEIWRFDPSNLEMTFVVGPVCGGEIPFSMAVDIHGVAWINMLASRSVQTLDLLDPGPCEASPYVRTNPDFGLFGMSFASRNDVDACADLYVMSYSGDGDFDEGPDLGKLGVIDPDSGELSELAAVDFDGGELTGTGDGRLFAIAGNNPLKLVEYDKETGALISTTPLDGVEKTNASATAFFGGDLYIFVEAVPAGCTECLQSTCAAAHSACRSDSVCNEHLECVLQTPVFSDECGGGLTEEMVTCLEACSACTQPNRVRVSRVLRFDLDNNEGGGVTEVVEASSIRVVGAASSPCVPVGPI